MLYQVYFYVPEQALECVKQAMFAAGAGKVGDYEACAWQIQGLGQFTPLASATPFIGEQGKLTVLNEYRVEMVCEQANLKAVLQAMNHAHPYQAVAHGAIPLITLSDV